jgi:hypothetical protein
MKNIVQLIKKIAKDDDLDVPLNPNISKPSSVSKDDDLDVPLNPNISKPSSVSKDNNVSVPSDTTAQKSKYVLARSPLIKEMQEKMQKLADIISEQIDFDSLFQGILYPQAANLQNISKSLGRTSFSNFMVLSYLRDSAVKGVEFDPDPKKSKLSQKMPSDLKNMYVVLDSIKRLGSESNEFAVDGIWGPRTNNSLRNIVAIADAILRISDDLGFKVKSFNSLQLKDLQSMIPLTDKDISLQEKNIRAPFISKYLDDLISLFKEFNEEILNSPYNKQQIEGASFITYKKSKTKDVPDMSDDEKNIYLDLVKNKNQSFYVQPDQAKFKINLGSGTPFIITAADLLNAQSLDNWASRNSYTNEWRKNPEHWKIVVDQIIKQVKQQINQQLSLTRVPEPKGI